MHRFLSCHLQILRSLVLFVSLCFIYFSRKLHPFLLSISVTNFMSDLKRALIIELLWTQSHCHGGLVCQGFGKLAPPNKAPSPPN